MRAKIKVHAKTRLEKILGLHDLQSAWGDRLVKRSDCLIDEARLAY